MKRLVCSACGHYELESFLDLGESPIADAYTSDPDEESPTYPLELAVCMSCWLVQLLELVDHRTLFGTGYSFYSSASAPLSSYHAAYAADVYMDHTELAKQLTVEIGCNDGDMLRHFDRLGCRTVGIDPAEGPVTAAHERGLHVLQRSFDTVLAHELRTVYGPAGVVIANHVLAHVENVAEVLEGIGTLIAPDGVACVEVQYLPDLLVNNAFDLVYHEHRNFFSLSSLESAVSQFGLFVVDAQLTDRQGGSLRVVLTHEPRRSEYVGRLRARELWLRDVAAYRGFQGRVERIRERLLELLARDMGERVVGYGAPAKATTLLNFCGIDHDVVPVIVDTTPAKQGRYVPSTGIPIVAPEQIDLGGHQTVLVNSWNYAPFIMRQHPEVTASGGRWIVPIPAPVLL